MRIASLVIISISIIAMTTSSVFTILSFASPSLKIRTIKSCYTPGSTVKIIITGGKPNAQYSVEVRGPVNEIVVIGGGYTDDRGSAVFTFNLDPNCRIGTYTVHVAVKGGEYDTTTFEVKKSCPVTGTGGTTGVPPPTAAQVTLNRALNRFMNANETFSALLDALSLLRLEERLANLSERLSSIEGLLDEARAEMEVGNYDRARELASSAYSMAEDLLREALKVARSALQEVIWTLGNATSDEDVLSLLDMAEERLGEVTAARPEESVDAVLASSRIIVAALRLSNVTGMEERVAELSRALNETRSELEAARSMIGELEGRVEELESQLLSMQQQLNATLGELEAAKSRVEQLEDENEQLRTRNAELEQRVAELEAALAARTTMLVAAVIAAVALAIVLAYQWLRGRRRG